MTIRIVDYSHRGKHLNSETEIAELVHLIDAADDLEELILTENVLGLEAAKKLSECLKNKKNLKKLIISDLFTGKNSSEIMPTLEHLFTAIIDAGASLEELDLSHNALGHGGINILANLLKSKSCLKLKTLRMNNNGIGIIGSKKLGPLLEEWFEYQTSQNTQHALSVFECGRNRLEDEGISNISQALRKISSLTTLFVYQNGIRESGAIALADVIKNNTRLRNIDFNDNLFLESGAKELASAMKYLEDLEFLNLGDCLIRNSGALAVINSLQCHKKLQKIDLGYNELTVRVGLKTLDKLLPILSLKNIILDGNCFGEEGLRLIESELKTMEYGCEVTFDEDEGEPEDIEEEFDEGSDNEEFHDCAELVNEIRKLNIN